MDAAEEQGVFLPYSCRIGACSTCLAKLKSGVVDQSEQCFLDKNQINQDFILTCVAYPKTNLELDCYQEELLY